MAVDAAVAFQQTTAEAGRGQADPVELRVGVSLGEVVMDEDGDCFGLPVVEAARLCDGAEAGQILVSDMVRRMCRSSRHPFRSLGARSLKGLDELIEVSAVEWRPIVEASRVDMADIDADSTIRERAPRMLDRIAADHHMSRVRARMLGLLDLGPGDHVLDVGCGVGNEAVAIREVVGATGLVVGVDKSATMVDEARARWRTLSAGNVEFVQGDATRLDFDDATFDATRCDRVFQYLLEGGPAMREIVRVTKPGGRVVVADTDWEMAVFDSDDSELTARITGAWASTRPNGRAGQRLFRYAKRAGLESVTVEGLVQIKTELDELYREALPAIASAAVGATAVTPDEASRWVASQEAAAAEGVFFRAFVTFIVSGRVPP